MEQGRRFILWFILDQFLFQTAFFIFLVFFRRDNRGRGITHRKRVYSLIAKIPSQKKYVLEKFLDNDVVCLDLIRMDRNAFHSLCVLLTDVGGLRDTEYLTVTKQVAIFLRVLAHHVKIRDLSAHFECSGETISKYFHSTLIAVLKLHTILLSTPKPVDENVDIYSWKPFQRCLGALDGTYVDCRPPSEVKPRYRNRKGDITTNVLAVCDINMRFSYVLPGWEGSAADGRVLKDTIMRRDGLRVPQGNYYLCDNGYTNGNGFLTPYRGVRYHLKEWETGARSPQNYKEFFNMKHAKARNVIERAFGLVKQRWAALRSTTFYPIQTQSHIILACCILDNFIRAEMGCEPLIESGEYQISRELLVADNPLMEHIEVIEPSQVWTNFRDNMAHQMFNDWIASRE